MDRALPIPVTLGRAAAAAAVAAVLVIGAVAVTSRPGAAATAAPSSVPAAASAAASAKASIWSRSDTVALWTAHGFTGADKPLNNGPRRWSGRDARGTNFQALGSSSDVTEVILNFTRTAAESPADSEVALFFDSYAPSARAWFDQQLAASPTKPIDTETHIGGTKVRMFTVIALDKILVTVALYR